MTLTKEIYSRSHHVYNLSGNLEINLMISSLTEREQTNR
jgi:hypothetical protein